MSDNRPTVYKEGDVWVYRASAIGRPLRCLTAARQGYDPAPRPDFLMKAAAAGNLAEIVVKQRLRDDGWKIRGEQGSVEVKVPGVDAIIRGHLDAMETFNLDGSKHGILEVKSMSDRVWQKWHRYGFDRFPTYAAQLSVYMYAAASDTAVYAVFNRDTQELDTTQIDQMPVPIEELFAKVRIVEWYGENGEDLPSCTGAEYPCEYSYLCDRGMGDSTFTDSSGDIAKLAAEYNELSKAISRLEAQKKELRAEIVKLVPEGKVAEPWGTVTVSNVTRRRLDTRAMQRELGDDFLEPYYSYSEYKQVRVAYGTKGQQEN